QLACQAWPACTGPDDLSVLPVPMAMGTAAPARWLAKARASLGGDGSGERDRQREFIRFLAATDAAYYQRLRQVVHEETDELVPVTGTQMTFGGAPNFDAMRDLDYLDEHIYVAHPVFLDDHWDSRDWRLGSQTATSQEMNRLLALSLRRQASKPFVVSEYNQPFPNPRGPEILPVMAALGALQDWDGLFFFEYLS